MLYLPFSCVIRNRSTLPEAKFIISEENTKMPALGMPEGRVLHTEGQASAKAQSTSVFGLLGK